MRVYADSSFLVAIYWWGESESARAARWLERVQAPLLFTPLHRHEVRTALRLKVFRKEITSSQREAACAAMDADLAEGILAHTAVPWTEAFREAERLSEAQVEALGVRSLDLLHVGIALALKAEEFLTFDTRQAALAKLAGLRLPL